MCLASHKVLASIVTLCCLAHVSSGAPVPIPDEEGVEEEGLLLLVPTVPVNVKGQPTKREIDYELISIPADIIKRTVREVTQAYGLASASQQNNLNGASGTILVSDLNTGEQDEIIFKTDKVVPSPNETYVRSTRQNSADVDAFLNGFDDHLVPSTSSTKPSQNSFLSNGNNNNLPVLSSTDLSKILSNVASVGFQAASTGANLAGQAKEALTTATRVGTSAVVGGTQAVRWVLKKKATGLRTFAEFAGAGLQYAGRLSSAVLKILLRIPGIKARVISDVIQAGQPLATAVSNVITESADDLQSVFLAQSDIFKDAIQLLIRLISDILALKGRILASLGAGGLDKGANLITSGVKVGSAFIQTAGDVFSAVGRGVGDLVKVASETKLPPPPALPQISFPLLPTITYPTSKGNSKPSYPPSEQKGHPQQSYPSGSSSSSTYQ